MSAPTRFVEDEMTQDFERRTAADQRAPVRAAGRGWPAAFGSAAAPGFQFGLSSTPERCAARR